MVDFLEVDDIPGGSKNIRLSSSKLMNFFQRTLADARSSVKFESSTLKAMMPHGPAVQFNVDNSNSEYFEFDLIVGIESREGQIYVPTPNYTYDPFIWRLSVAARETELVLKASEGHRCAARTIKAFGIFDLILKSMPTYWIKITVLHLSTEEPGVWSEDQLGLNVIKMMTRLLKYITDCYMPGHHEANLNLLKMLNDGQRKKIQLRLHSLITNEDEMMGLLCAR